MSIRRKKKSIKLEKLENKKYISLKTLSIKVWWLTSVSYIVINHGDPGKNGSPPALVCLQSDSRKGPSDEPQKPNSNSLFPKDTKSFKI